MLLFSNISGHSNKCARNSNTCVKRKNLPPHVRFHHRLPGSCSSRLSMSTWCQRERCTRGGSHWCLISHSLHCIHSSHGTLPWATRMKGLANDYANYAHESWWVMEICQMYKSKYCRCISVCMIKKNMNYNNQHTHSHACISLQVFGKPGSEYDRRLYTWYIQASITFTCLITPNHVGIPFAQFSLKLANIYISYQDMEVSWEYGTSK